MSHWISPTANFLRNGNYASVPFSSEVLNIGSKEAYWLDWIVVAFLESEQVIYLIKFGMSYREIIKFLNFYYTSGKWRFLVFNNSVDLEVIVFWKLEMSTMHWFYWNLLNLLIYSYSSKKIMSFFLDTPHNWYLGGSVEFPKGISPQTWFYDQQRCFVSYWHHIWCNFSRISCSWGHFSPFIRRDGWGPPILLTCLRHDCTDWLTCLYDLSFVRFL